MKRCVLQFDVDADALERITEADALNLLRESLHFSADYLKRRTLSLESLEYVAMEEAANWVGHLAKAAEDAQFLTFELQPISKT